METENNANNEPDAPEKKELGAVVEPEKSTEDSKDSGESTDNAKSTEESETDTKAETSEPKGESETIGQNNDPNEVDVLFVDPAPQTTYKTDAYEIDVIHSMTMGDLLTSTLLAVLIIVVFLSKVLGGRY